VLRSLKPVVVSLVLAGLAAGCSGSSGSPVPSAVTSSPAGASKLRPSDTLGGVGNMGVGMLNVLLCDAPPRIGNMTATAIDLGIDSVAVIDRGTVTTLATYATPYVVNVMNNAGAPSPIAIGEYYQGSYHRLRFTIDVASSNVVANGQSYPIAFLTHVPTQSSVGAGITTVTGGNARTITMTVRGDFQIDGNAASALQADFNALESLAPGPDGGIVARPTLFAIPDALAGKVDGMVQSASGTPVSGATVVALKPDGSVANTTSTDANGVFDLHTIAAGSYHLMIYNAYTTASGQTLTASGNGSSAAAVNGPTVTVTAAQTNNVGTIAD
jgi:hypothetical protein